MREDDRPEDFGSTEFLSQDLPDSKQIGPYVLREKIGEGGMGEFWLADQKDPILRKVALKVIKRSLDE
jgi:serine/threonine protein kinase